MSQSYGSVALRSKDWRLRVAAALQRCDHAKVIGGDFRMGQGREYQ